MKFAAVLTALLLAGCTTPTLQIADLRSGDGISLLPANGPGYDYVVSIKRASEIGYDTMDQATRDRIALAYLQPQCPRATIAGEDDVEMGESLIGSQRATYFIRVKCN